MTALTDVDLAMLDFEHQRFLYAGIRDQAIRDQFDLTPTQYAQRLNALLDDPEALRHAPTLVRRLRRLRATRQRVGA